MSVLETLVARAEVLGGESLERPRTVLAVGLETLGLLILIGLGIAFALFGYLEVAIAYWVFGGLLVLNVVTGLAFGKIRIARFNALVIVLVMPFVLMFLLGGFTATGVSVASLALLSPMAAMLLVKRERAVPLIGGVVAMLLLMVLLQPLASEFDPAIPDTTAAVFAALHLSLVCLVLSGLSYIVHGRLEDANRRADALLLNILPESIAVRLKEDPSKIADSHEEVTVLFADIVGFTPLSAGMSAEEVVTLLNQIFSAFDDIVDDMGLEKIKTIGDEYMVAGGLPAPRVDHAEAIADFALAIRDHLSASEFGGHRIQMRIGINSGPVVSGVIGSRKFAYDLWGDVVNTASRMESEGMAGDIQISESTHELIKDKFTCEPRGKILVKGKGEMPTYVLTSRRRETSAP